MWEVHRNPGGVRLGSYENFKLARAAMYEFKKADSSLDVFIVPAPAAPPTTQEEALQARLEHLITQWYPAPEAAASGPGRILDLD